MAKLSSISSSWKGTVLVGALVEALQPAARAVTDDMQVRCDGQSQIIQVVKESGSEKSSGREGGHGNRYIYRQAARVRLE